MQNAEIQRGYSSQIVFQMTTPDIFYLISTVWGSESVLSQEKELFRLTMVRWDADVEWSPWNCILLTKDEAVVHAEMGRSGYGEGFKRAVTQKHMLARSHFLSLLDAQEKRAETRFESPARVGVAT